MDCYTYAPLDSTSDNFRLATMMPGNDNIINIELQTHTLSTAPPFLALSYAWGSIEDTRKICVNGKTMRIRGSLWNGLHALMGSAKSIVPANDGPASPIAFWADALCIDQSNISERNHQVNMMQAIYTSAFSVVVYLGPASVDSDEAMRAISQERLDYPRASHRNRPHGWTHNNDHRIPHETCEAILNLFQRPYWQRLWVVQEILMAPQIVVLCGDAILEWAMLEILVNLASNFFANGQLGQTIFHTQACWVIRDKALQPSGPFMPQSDLASVVFKYGEQACTDPRDKVYGLLGLVDFKNETPIVADYSLSLEEVYGVFSAHLSRKSGISEGEMDFYKQECRRAMCLDEDRS